MTSDGDALTIPEGVSSSQRYINLQKALSRKDKGSAGREKILRKMAACRFKVANRRKEWLETTTTNLAQRYACAVIEDLKTSSMTNVFQLKSLLQVSTFLMVRLRRQDLTVLSLRLLGTSLKLV